MAGWHCSNAAPRIRCPITFATMVKKKVIGEYLLGKPQKPHTKEIISSPPQFFLYLGGCQIRIFPLFALSTIRTTLWLGLQDTQGG